MSIDWPSDDPVVLNALVVVAASSFAVALVCCLRRHADAIRSVILASLHWSVVHTVESTSPSVAPVLATEEKERKSTRSKERRRRGKDPLRDLFKSGKKSRALLKAIKATDHDHSLHSADALSNSGLPHNDTASSTSRSQSPDPATDMDCLARVESDDGSVRSTTPNGNSSSASAVTSDRDAGDTSSSPPELMTAADMQNNLSSASTIMPEDALSSPPVSADIRTPQPRDSQAAYTSGACAKLVRARTKLRLSRMDPATKSSLLSSTPSPLPDSVAIPSNYIYTCPSLSSTYSTDGNGPSTPTVSRGPTPPSQSPSSEDPSLGEPPAQPLDQSTAIELASMRNALEAARLREEQLRAEAEQASKERDELRWGWNEDAVRWRRREAELQAQMHHLMQQLQAYAAVASFQAQQASSSFSSPTSPHAHSSPRVQQHPLAPFLPPPVMQTQTSTSAPAHVQAVLASTPMLTSHSPGYAAYPGPGFGMSPLLWSGLGLCVPSRDARHGGRRTPDSSASSSSRGRRPRRHSENPKSASDESSPGDWDGIEDGSGDEDPWEEEEEEDIFSNNVLADAILKRPESIRELSGVGKRSGGRPPMQGVGERKDTLKDPALEKLFVDSPPSGNDTT